MRHRGGREDISGTKGRKRRYREHRGGMERNVGEWKEMERNGMETWGISEMGRWGDTE